MCASRKQILFYDDVSRLIGVPRQGLGKLLEPVQSFCILKNLPPLSSLVVSEGTGLPGEGFIAASDVPKAQANVFRYDWLSRKPPTSDQLEAAVVKLPSNGRSLKELRKVVGKS
jgi:hypothetical protein